MKKQSEARYRDLFENANDGLFICDDEGCFTTFNNAFLEILGETKDKVIGSHYSKYLNSQDLEIGQNDLIKTTFEESLNGTVNKEITGSGGEHRWIEIKFWTIKEGNEIAGVHGIARDITEKMKMEKELKESEAKYRNLFENAQDAMYVLDKEGFVLKMNQVGLRILGCTKEEVIGKNISNWLTSRSIKIVEERRKKFRSGEKVNETEVLEIVRDNGGHRWVEIKTRQINDKGGAMEIHGIGRDITENLLLKKELNKSNKQRKLLYYLIKGTRGGKSRTLILKHLIDKPYNANQLANALEMDYKTVRHHLDVLIKNGMITRNINGNNDLYFLSESIESDLNEFDSI